MKQSSTFKNLLFRKKKLIIIIIIIHAPLAFEPTIVALDPAEYEPPVEKIAKRRKRNRNLCLSQMDNNS